ncbi:uncharacterized protein K441DRAFT_565242, partial [Cenococcum geophilum 1.58]|uniref:uncharacterized protein n=1 Tax=Cenococcum geophilum 1.58 TaxID=794803 RepID=UPI00358E234D
YCLLGIFNIFLPLIYITYLYITWPKTLQLRYLTRYLTRSITLSLITALNRLFFSS